MNNLWNQIFGKGKEISSSYKYENCEAAINRYIKRLNDIHQEIAEIGRHFEESSQQIKTGEATESLEETITLVNKFRIPGYCAYKLAEEGLTLVHLLSVKIALLKNEDNKSNADIAELDNTVEFLDVSEQSFNQVLEEMPPYKSLKDVDVIQETLTRITDKNS